MEGRNDRKRWQQHPWLSEQMLILAELTRNMFNYLTQLDGVTMQLPSRGPKLKQREDKTWRIKVTD
jgi:malate dehydrogenase (quinone)